jgi:hypothetical protein
MHGSSPRVLLWPWGGDERMWRSTTSSMVGGTMRFASSKTTYTTAVEELASVL